MRKGLKRCALILGAIMLSSALAVSMAACKDDEPTEVVVSLSATADTLALGESMTLTATTSDGSAVTWMSTEPEVATVSEDGTVTAVGRGTTQIVAFSETGEQYYAVCEVVVSAALENEAGEYTYHSTFSTSPYKWNPHTWENNTDSIILGFITMGFYDVAFTYDENGKPNGTTFMPEMAGGEPEDVTAQYVGEYGVKEGDERKAWRIPLNENAVWENGDEIVAADYVYSMQQQLDPEMLNRRSDSFTGGTFNIYGAYNYLYSKTPVIYKTLDSAGYATVKEAQDAGETVYIDMYNTWGMQGMVDANGNACPQYVPIDDTTEYRDLAVADENEEGAWISGKYVFDYFVASGYDDATLIANGFLFIAVENENMDYGWDYKTDGTGGVGLLADGDNAIIIILENEISDFYLKYNLSSNWLVHEETYEAGMQEQSGIMTSTYYTSLDTTISYGPYKLTQFYTDQYFVLEKNENWYGYTDGKHEGMYQTTAIDYTYVSGENTKSITKELFLQGRMEDYALNGTEYPDYETSRYLISEPESYTYQFFLSNNAQALEDEDTATENHSVLQLTTFRRALSYALDRNEFVQAFAPTAQAGFGILNYLYIYDPDTGAIYRETEPAMKAILLYQGYTDNGDGTWTDPDGVTKYDTLEDAYETVTGYNPQYAADLFEEAYKEAKEMGIYDDAQDVVIYYGTPAVGTSTAAMVQQFNEMFAEALELCDGDTFKSVRIELDTHYGSEDAYWEAVKAGTVDLSFSAWGGSAMDPWGIIYSCYINPANSNNYGFDTLSKTIDITVEFNGEDVTASFYDWAVWLYNGQKDDEYDKTNLYTKLGVAVGDAEYDFKLEVLAQCELAQLNTYCNLPIYYSEVASLHSAKYKNGSDTYVNNMIGYGGIRYITYEYDDAQWAAFVAEHNGNLEDFYLAS